MKLKSAIILLIVSLYFGHQSMAQEVQFRVDWSADTIIMGSVFELKYSVENLQGEFVGPQFEGLRLIAGPNVSSQFSMVNGEVSQSASYTYFLEPIQPGVASITEAAINDGSTELTTDAISIVVLEEQFGLNPQVGGRYQFNQIITFADSNLTKSDSLRLKLKKLKTVKI